ncbi:hypothetical protein Nmel_002289, partial [Mimus melanotis]
LGAPAPLSTPGSLRSVRFPDFFPLFALHESALLGARVRVRSGEERREGDWDNSWSGLFIPVGNTSLYGLQDAVGSLGNKAGIECQGNWSPSFVYAIVNDGAHSALASAVLYGINIDLRE